MYLCVMKDVLFERLIVFLVIQAQNMRIFEDLCRDWRQRKRESLSGVSDSWSRDMRAFSSKSYLMFYTKKHYFEVIGSCLDSETY